jgi:hypothetical protein
MSKNIHITKIFIIDNMFGHWCALKHMNVTLLHKALHKVFIPNDKRCQFHHYSNHGLFLSNHMVNMFFCKNMLAIIINLPIHNYFVILILFVCYDNLCLGTSTLTRANPSHITKVRRIAFDYLKKNWEFFLEWCGRLWLVIKCVGLEIYELCSVEFYFFTTYYTIM